MFSERGLAIQDRIIPTQKHCLETVRYKTTSDDIYKYCKQSNIYRGMPSIRWDII